jgi:iron complex outermembrane receptor protein
LQLQTKLQRPFPGVEPKSFPTNVLNDQIKQGSSMQRLVIIFLLLIHSLSYSQSWVRGTVADIKSREPLIGAAIVIDDSTGTTAGIDGSFIVSVPAGPHKIEFRNLSYVSNISHVVLNPGDTLTFNMLLAEDARQLDIVVISAGKFEQNLNEVTVSMEVLKPQLIENKSLQSIENAVDQVPGVNVIDGQANIRGGSGFSYGAGSRVLLMVDEMPMLSADAGDVKWTFLPIENCEQIEVIKGASSALFGSSALNGVINFRTAYAKEKPETKISMYGGFYDKPKRRELAWWQTSTHVYQGMNVYHAHKLGQLDLVVGANVYDDEGYRYHETEQRYRGNVNLRYRFTGKLEGLQAGINANTIRTKGGLFLIWENPDSGAYRPAGGDLSHYITYRTNIDPFITYLSKSRWKQTLRTRFYRTRNTNNTNQESVGDVYYTEYQVQKRFFNQLSMTTGLVYNYQEVKSGELYGTHYSANASAFLQLDKKWNRLNASFGLRAEYFKTDSIESQENIYLLMDRSKPLVRNSKVRPLLRAGLNYKLLEATYLRGSFGQGFRFPAVAERFIRTSASGLEIYPNDSLRPESGWSAEIGVKQGLRLGEWRGYLDIAGFITEYQDMMEFSFGKWGDTFNDPAYGLGFKSRNIGNTRITGVDISLMGEGKIGPVQVTALIGYTYINPRQTDFDAARDTATNTSKNDILKYRYRHTGKGDVEFGYKRFATGLSCRANSFMENIDVFFVDKYYFPGMQRYRDEHNKGDIIFDYRISYQLLKVAKASFIVNNIFNREVMGRPADFQPPRVYVLQLTVKF